MAQLARNQPRLHALSKIVNVCVFSLCGVNIASSLVVG